MSRRPDEGGVRMKGSPEVYLLSLLSRTPLTRAAAIRKLRDRGVAADVAEALAAKFEEAGYIDDAAYALLFVDSRPEWGPRRLRDELAARGVARDLIERALEEVDELERALSLATEWRSLGMERAKIEGRLVRRGFSASVCRKAVNGTC